MERPDLHWRASSWAQEQVARLVGSGIETYANSGNGGGKSAIGARLDRAFCAGEDHILDRHGCPMRLPVLAPPVHWGLGVQTYKLGGAASIQALRDVLGNVEHKMVNAGSSECPSMIRIRHAKARNESEWSTLYVFPYDGPRPEGPRLDGWHCDEPPPAMFLDAFRTRTKRGRRLFGYITMTPIEKRHWEPILKGFEGNPWVRVGGEIYPGQIVGRRARVEWCVEDNEMMSPEQIADMRMQARGPWFDARWYGKHINLDGNNPWIEHIDVLRDALAACVPPRRVERINIEAAADGIRMDAELQVWEDPIPGDPYVIIGDPAKGIRDDKHDPDGMHIRNRRTGQLAVRLSGYIGAWALGQVMADMHERYNDALCDPLVNGIGEALVQSLRRRKVRHFTHDRVESKPGEWRETIGTSETHEVRKAIIGAVDREIVTGTLRCPSAAVIQCLLDCRQDENGRIAAGTGAHDEDLICWGRGSVILGQWDAPKPKPKPVLKYKSPLDQLMEDQRKKDAEITDRVAARGRLPRPRMSGFGSGAITIDP